MIKVVKKDGTLEDFNVQKVVDAVNKSACRVLINFTEEEEKFICQFVEEKVFALGIDRIEIALAKSISRGSFKAMAEHIIVAEPDGLLDSRVVV